MIRVKCGGICLKKKYVYALLAVVDIGSASFKYDMRRLTEILAFPKAWYRRSIIRRLFLGDLTRAPVFSDGEDESGPDHSEEMDHENNTEDER